MVRTFILQLALGAVTPGCARGLRAYFVWSAERRNGLGYGLGYGLWEPIKRYEAPGFGVDKTRWSGFEHSAT